MSKKNTLNHFIKHHFNEILLLGDDKIEFLNEGLSQEFFNIFKKQLIEAELKAKEKEAYKKLAAESQKLVIPQLKPTYGFCNDQYLEADKSESVGENS